MATLLFLGASVSQIPAIRYARDAGHRVVTVDGDPDAPGFPLANTAVAVDFSDVDAVSAVAERERADGVLAVCTDRAVVPAALVAARVGLPGIGAEVAHAMTHKPTMRARLSEHGIPQPRHVVVRADSDLEAALATVGALAVLKPADSGGQRGLFVIRARDDLERRLPEVLALSRTGEAMLEEYVEGLELNALLAVRDGTPTTLTLSDRLRPAGAGFGVGWIHSFPSSLPPEALERVRETAESAVRALGQPFGIAFPQVLAGEQGVLVVEVAARIAAGQMADLVRQATGIEVFEIAIRQALGEPVPDRLLAPRFSRPVAIRFLTASPGPLPVGTVTAIEGLDAVRMSPGVLDAGLYFEAGATIRPLQVDADRRGYVIATGDTATRALELADRAAKKLVVRTEHGSWAGRRRRLPVALAACVAAAVAIVLALVLAHGNSRNTLVSGASVGKRLMPLCRCPSDVTHVAFRLLRRTPVIVQMLAASGAPVATLIHDRILGVGPVRVEWNGRDAHDKLVAPGRYFAELIFPKLKRKVRVHAPVTVSVRPKSARAET